MEMEPMLDYTGKTVIVTGARSGIGKATAIAFAKRGANVVVSGRRPCDETEAIIKENGLGTSKFIKCDVSNEEEVKNLIAETVDTFGQLNVAVNNAGTNIGTVDFIDQTTDDYNMIMNVDARGIFFCMKYEIIEMLKEIEAGTIPFANIVNVSSVAGLIADPGMAPYIGAKHAVSGLTRAAGIEYAAKGIRINAIAPGFTASEQTQHWIDNPEMCALVASYNYQNRIADPSEIANVALFLGSDLCSFMGGAIVPVDAGQTAH